jgi:hypothetical protein
MKRKIIDERGRLFGVISVIDVIVIVVIAVLAIAAYTKFRVIDNTSTSTKTVPVTYTVRILSVREGTANALREGDAFFTKSGIPAGKIASVEITPSRVLSGLADGTYVMADVEGRVDALITVAAQCSITNDRYYVDRTYELNVNTDQTYHTKYVEIYGNIASITKDAVDE